MINKKDQSDPIDNLEYEKVLEEEIINSYENKFLKDIKPDKKRTKLYRLKRTKRTFITQNKRATSCRPNSFKSISFSKN